MQVFDLQRKVIADYEAYIRSFLAIRDVRIQALVDAALKEGHLWPDPLIQLNPSFEPGPAMQQLVVVWHNTTPLRAPPYRPPQRGLIRKNGRGVHALLGAVRAAPAHQGELHAQHASADAP